MRLATRFGLAGIAPLALLAATHRLRDMPIPLPPAGHYLLGVTPNFAAAIAITFVLLSIWSNQNHDANYALTRRWFLICAAISGSGLMLWEFFQTMSRTLVFDPNDIGATIFGVGVAGLVFYLLTPREDRAA